MNIDQLKAKFPAEAALISDLSIGKLSGATAALESQLVGIPSGNVNRKLTTCDNAILTTPGKV